MKHEEASADSEEPVMALQITIDIFSGRPNPVLEISGKQAREILERVRPAKRLSRAAMPAPEFRLGYRGLIIQQKGAISRGLPPIFRVAAGAIYGIQRGACQ